MSSVPEPQTISHNATHQQNNEVVLFILSFPQARRFGLTFRFARHMHHFLLP